MFIGHFAVGLASKRVAPRTSLGWLVTAPVLADVIWPVLVLLGVERVRVTGGSNPFLQLTFDSYPWSHSLLMLVVWGGAFGAIYYGVTKYRAGALALFVGVVSHWVLDWVTHRPDMPIAPGVATAVGLGLWNSVAGTVVIESLMFVAGIWLYVKTTHAKDRIGRWGFVGWVLFLAAGYLSQFSGSPPPSVAAIAWVGIIAGGVTLVWAGWVDRHREGTMERGAT